MCGVTMVVAHQSVDEPSNCFCSATNHSHSRVCVAKVVLKWQWLPCHTHHDACDEPPIPTTHTSVCAQMVDMEVVVVLVMAMECDGAFMVTITTLVSCHSLKHSHSEEGDGKRDSGGFTPPHNTIKWWLVGVAGVQARWMMSAKKGWDHTQSG